jgi:hypothetical protein
MGRGGGNFWKVDGILAWGREMSTLFSGSRLKTGTEGSEGIGGDRKIVDMKMGVATGRNGGTLIGTDQH